MKLKITVSETEAILEMLSKDDGAEVSTLFLEFTELVTDGIEYRIIEVSDQGKCERVVARASYTFLVLTKKQGSNFYSFSRTITFEEVAKVQEKIQSRRKSA